MSGKGLRIVYMGTPEFAVAPLKVLVENGYNVVGVVTTPDKPAGRGLKVQESAVKKYATGIGLPVLQPERLKAEDFLDALRGYAADVFVIVAFRMLPEVVWSMPPMGTFNLHASLLPQYRGAAPINWALINGEKKSGVTTFYLNDRMDEGAIIARREVEITPQDNAGSLHDKLMEAGSGLVRETVDMIASGEIVTFPQENNDPATLKPAPKIFKETGRVDFKRDGAEIINLIRGLSPYPAAWSEMSLISKPTESPVNVKIFSASFQSLPTPVTEAGTILSDGKSFIKVTCNDGFIDILELQVSGKKRMSVTNFLKGFRAIADYKFI